MGTDPVERPDVHMHRDAVTEVVTFEQQARDALIRKVLEDGGGIVARKSSRIVALQVPVPFVVQTDRGPMRGRAGDWLVTNHPDDDEGSDLWSISDERMRATYEWPAEVRRKGGHL